MAYVIVTPGGDCEHYPGHECIRRVDGPYQTRAEARAVFDQLQADGERPHWMTLNPPDSPKDQP